jgi:hypothetical protein
MLVLKAKTFLIASVLVFAFQACNHVRISDLSRDPGKYYNKDVTVAGRVSQSFGLMGNGAYQIDDGSGTIWIISEGFGVPGNGAKVSATGRLISSGTFGGRSLGLALRQTKRR